MNKLSERLSKLKAGKIIDIATRDGAFIKQLIDNLDGFDEIVGIDISDKGFSKAKEKFEENANVRFEVMDAYHTDFPDNYFDLVCISNSLHHIENIPKLLKEIRRIKSKEGIVLISELPSDGQFGSSLTHALIHNLDCVIDTYCGSYHRKTYSHKEIYEFVLGAGLTIIDDFDDVEVNQSKNIAIESRVDKALDKVNNYKSEEYYKELHSLAMEIQDNYKKYGANTAIQYIIFAK